tara:strand:- start:32 stop:811 length:780 start_codon:yes stop_codon:yes gene_type:complete
MNKIFKIILLIKLILVVSAVYVYAATGAASVYKVTMRKVELCKSSNNVSTCEEAVVIGTGDKTVDIASVDAGAAAASYGNPALLPLGEVYTHMRVTIDRKFTIKTKSAIDTGESGDTDNCLSIATTDTMYQSDEATDKYTHKTVVAEGGNSGEAEEMDIYLINDQYTRCNVANCSNRTADQTLNYAQGTGSARYQTQHLDGSSSADHVLVYKLTTPYVVSLIPPVIDISFGTSASVSANEVNSLCQIWAEEPVVTITIK